MEIGPEKPAIIVEPAEDPFQLPRETPAPEREKLPLPEPAKQPEKVPA